ncbi:dual OB domain-containing protein [Acinetobacter baumannii]|uniref:dual OB domain-containing protein n=1 Tax=Acinetobacter baumannii TaxID=470 RepID=UPI00389146A0
MYREIIVFANSVKHGNSCVAGKCTRTGEWIRPVSDSTGSAILESQTKILNKRKGTKWPLKTLQKIGLNLSEHAPLVNHQPENYIITQEDQWTDQYKISVEEAEHYLDHPSDLWGEGGKVNYDSIKNQTVIINSSLYLVKLDKLELYKDLREGETKRRAKFLYNGISYDFAVTAREFDRLIGTRQEITLNNVIICTSLAENYNGYCYKRIASIIC